MYTTAKAKSKLKFNGYKKKMGIKGLFKVKFNGVELKSLGKKLEANKNINVCVDASLQIYSAYISANKESKNHNRSQKENGIKTFCLYFLINIIHSYKKFGFNQRWVFDNEKPHSAKFAELKKRREKRKEGDFVLTKEFVETIKELLSILKIPYIVAPYEYEAEHFAANLCATGCCDGVITRDTDVLAFGGNLIKKDGNSWYQFDHDRICSGLTVTSNEFVKICVALGSDFSEKVPRIGPATVVKKVKAGDVKFNSEQLLAISLFEKKWIGECKFIVGDRDIDTIEFLQKWDLCTARVTKMIEEISK